MIIPQKDYVEQEQIGEFKEITSTISEKNLSLVLDNVTKNLYSDPIGAFVRELTSNAVDANKRNYNSEKVKVRIYKESDSIYFEVKDEGKGMTPKVFEEVYMSWFESDKRNDNGQIGGWGIGSKSPLAYTEYYELSTIAEGIQYDYEIVRQAPAPVATLINSFATNKKSGTTVKVEVKNSDDWKLHMATVKQLVYFDNVIVTNEIYYYDNHFKILDHPLFMVRSDEKYPFDKDMHIVIGQVAYPINWNLLGIPRVRVPVGLKFDIGEIPVDLSREVIRYVDDADNAIDVKSVIIKRVKEAKEVLKQLYLERLTLFELKDYVHAINNPRTTINLGGYEVYFGIEMKNVKHNLNINGEIFSFPKEHIDKLLKAFETIDLSKREGSNIRYPSILDIFNSKQNYVHSTTGQLEHWSSLFHKERQVIRRKKLTKQMVNGYASILGLTIERTIFGKFKTVLQSGAIKKVLAFRNAIEQVIHDYTYCYEDVPQQFIDDEKARQEALKEERKGNITYYNEAGNKTVVTLKSLIENYQYVFYVSRSDSDEKKRAFMAMYNSFDSVYNSTYKGKTPRILVVILSETTIAKVKNKTKDLTIKQSYRENGKKKRRYVTKPVYAFLSADKMFKFTELYTQFHKLRYTTLLHSVNRNDMLLNSLSTYYFNLVEKIPTTDTYRINRDSSGRDYIYPYLYFKKEIDAITKNRNYEHEIALNEFMKVADALYLISKNLHDLDNNLIIQRLIKTYKLTKLKTHHYGYL